MPSLSASELLTRVFGVRASIVDARCISKIYPIGGPTGQTAESAFGIHVAALHARARLADRVSALLDGNKVGRQLGESLSGWLAARGNAVACDKALEFSDQWLVREGAFDAEIGALYAERASLPKRSLWVILDDAGAGADVAALHHVLAAREDINVLVISTSGEKTSGVDALGMPHRDLGLYALNYGGSYVASTSPLAARAHFDDALRAADASPGPALVLAHLPESGEVAASTAVDSGSWPLYRSDPAAEKAGREPFTADSAALRTDIAEFAARASQLSLLAAPQPQLPEALVGSAEATVTAAADASAAALRASYARLLGAIELPPLLVTFGSDGGNAEKIAVRIANEARKKGFASVSIRVMDSVSLEDLAAAPIAVLVVSTAGQGDFPSNARAFEKLLHASTSTALASLKFAVFGLGDSNYWPRKEHAHFFNKASVDLDVLLSAAGGSAIVERGVGDDQSVGGFQGDFRKWIPTLWAALGCGTPGDDGSAGAPKLRAAEQIKATSNYLRGTIAQGLNDTSTGQLAYEDTLLTKFHGIYQQDDRDTRGARARAGLEPAYSFMVRVRLPGGVCSPSQYLALDDIADVRANGTIRITTRQAVQFHGIIKSNLKRAIAETNRSLMDTIAACGDVNRNVMCSPNPDASSLYAAVLEFSKRLSDHLTPRTTAYAEIWLDEVLVAGSGAVDVEPIYGPNYLPRKFKIAVAIPPHNDVDCFAHDMGFIAIANEDGSLKGFTITAGGGMGTTHNAPATFPRLGEALCFATPEDCVAIAEACVTTQRDFGDRKNRRHARFKYTVDDHGIEWLRDQVAARTGLTLEPPHAFVFTSNGDKLGWTSGPDGTSNYTFFVENGRIKDKEAYRLKSGLVALCKLDIGDVRFTPNQNVLLACIPAASVARVKELLVEYGIGNGVSSGLRLNSMACVALPTCGLALAESERYLPTLVDKLGVILEACGLRDDAITIRMTGCPNGW